MPRLPSDITDSTLLCERCGYVLEGLDENGACPECGQRIAESLPSRRTGTPFQQSPGWNGLLRHYMALAKVPGELFANLQIRHESDLKLELVGCFVAAAVMIGPYGVVHGLIDSFELLFLLPMLLCIPAMFVFMFLTWIERTGIVFFARRRGWRIPASVAAAICACATPGWIAASTLLNVGAALMLVLQKIITDMPPTWQPWMESAAAALPFLGFIAGMLVFETLVYIGVRRCKYANWLTRPDRDQQSGRMDPE